MGLNYKNLNKTIRNYMLSEIELDIKNNSIYFSKRLNAQGKKQWVSILEKASKNYDDVWLEEKLESLITQYEYRNINGLKKMVKTPYTAPMTLAEGEFNRFYMRGLCQFAIDNNINEVIVYSAKKTSLPRSSSLSLLKSKFLNPQKILNDLRTTQGMETLTKLGLANSSLSLMLPK